MRAVSADVLVERTAAASRLSVRSRARELLHHREILANLIRRELKVKYASSALGAIWSVLNPVVFLAVFGFVVRVTGTGFDGFPIYLLSGLLAWNLFSSTLNAAARSVVDNGNLVRKVAFPHEVLPLSAVGVALVDFVLQAGVLLVFVVASGHGLRLPVLALLPLAIAALLVVATAAALWVAALNVRYRDVQHLLGIGLLVWFWFTPIVYAGRLVVDALAERTVLGIDAWGLYLVNPMASIVFGFQRAIFGEVAPGGVPVMPDVGVGWLAGALAAVLAVGLVGLRLAWGSFHARSADFAEDL